MLSNQFNLQDGMFHGIILDEPDSEDNQGKYKVHIPELQPFLEEDSGIFALNHIHSWRSGSSDDHFYGNYYPLQPGSKVVVKFSNNDFNSGEIIRIISDNLTNQNPKIAVKKNPPPSIKDRDEVYLLYKTPKKHNMFLILEDTEDSESGLDKVANSIHLYYNYRRTTLIINEDGIHWFTMDNRGITVEGNNNKWVEGNEKNFIQCVQHNYINDEQRNAIKNSQHNLVKNGSQYNSAPMGSIHQQAKNQIACDAGIIYLNCGKSSVAKGADWNKGEDEEEIQKKVDQKIVPHQDTKSNPDSVYSSGEDKSTNIEEPNKIFGGQPSEGHPKKDNNSLEKGLDDRHSTVGAEQTGDPIRGYSEYGPK